MALIGRPPVRGQRSLQPDRRDPDARDTAASHIGPHGWKDDEGWRTSRKTNLADHLFCCEQELDALCVWTRKILSEPGTHVDPLARNRAAGQFSDQSWVECEPVGCSSATSEVERRGLPNFVFA
jgi:hypothetical protein